MSGYWRRALLGSLLLAGSLGLLGGGQGTTQMASASSGRQNSGLQDAQGQFVLALQQAGAIGGESDVQSAWSAYVRALVAYAGTSNAWLTGPQTLTAMLNRASAPLVYQVSDTGTGVSRVRTILVADQQIQGYGPDICPGWRGRYPLYATQIMVTASPAGSTQTEVMGQIVNDRMLASNDYFTTFPSVDDAFDNSSVWITPDHVRHMMAIIHTLCGGSGGDFPHLLGLRQAPGQRFWVRDAAMVPQDPAQDGTLMFQQLHFVTPTGSVIRLSAAFESSTIAECNACMHAFGERLYTRVGTVYHPSPWHLLPSPYLTLVQAVSAAKSAQQGPVNECTPDTLSGLAANDQAARRFCAVLWQGAGNVRVVHGPDNLFPPYKPGATILSVDADTGGQSITYLVTMTRSSGAWVISDVRRP